MTQKIDGENSWDERTREDLAEILGYLKDEYVENDISNFESFAFSAFSVARDFRGLGYGYISLEQRSSLLFEVLQDALERRPANRTEVHVPKAMKDELMDHLDRVAGRDGVVRSSATGGHAFAFSMEPAGKMESAFHYGARMMEKLGFSVSPATVVRYRKEYTKKKAD
jgi:GNAT superfamily N-acetyltransferase